MKPDDARPELEDELEPFLVEGRKRLFGLRHEPQPEFVEIRCELCAHARRRLRTGSRACRSEFNDLPLQSLRDGLGSRCGIELPEQRFDMEFDGMWRDAELSGCSLVAQAIAERGKHLDFACRQ